MVQIHEYHYSKWLGFQVMTSFLDIMCWLAPDISNILQSERLLSLEDDLIVWPVSNVILQPWKYKLRYLIFTDYLKGEEVLLLSSHIQLRLVILTDLWVFCHFNCKILVKV